MEEEYNRLREEIRKTYFPLILEGSFDEADEELTYLLGKYQNHPDYLDEASIILANAKNGESIIDYSIRRRKEFSDRQKPLSDHVKDILVDLENTLTHRRFQE
jgi:hypothetical protein